MVKRLVTFLTRHCGGCARRRYPARNLGRVVSWERRRRRNVKPMEKTTLSKILEEVRTLARNEQAQLRGALDALLAEPEPGSAEEKVERLLFERGLLSEVKGPITDFGPYRDRKLVQVEGRPLSEVIIEERR